MKYLSHICLWSFLISSFPRMLSAQEDLFSKIGGQRYEQSTGVLVEPTPEVFERSYLPIGKDPLVRLRATNRSYTKEALATELAQLRRTYAPFLTNQAPPVGNYRKQLPLSSMKWREETVADRQNFNAVLQGEGKWESVTIPHYGPPQGRAVTYYYKEVEVSDAMLTSRALYLCFKGIDYKAHVFLNDAYCGSHEGFFAPFEFNVSKYAKCGTNRLLIKVENEPTTLGSIDTNGEQVVGNKIYAAGGLGWDEPMVGWHVCPPGMGIYQECYLESRAFLHVNDVFVRPLPKESKAEAWIELNNDAPRSAKTKLLLSLYGQNFKQTLFEDSLVFLTTVHVPGKGDLAKPTDWQQKELTMEYGVNYARIPFNLPDFRWWTPDQPYLYQLQVKVVDEQGKMVDSYTRVFGMRTFEMDTVTVPKGRLFLNGKQIKLRGANSMGFEQQDVKNKKFDQLVDDILLAKLCNMNFIRFTQRPVNSEVYAYCDQLGMLNQTDFPMFGTIRRNQVVEVLKQVEEMERLVRSHPSTVMITYINERFPNGEGRPHRNLNQSAEYFKLFKAMDQVVLLSNPDRVIKAGDGDYDPPTPGLPDNHCYNTWYNGHGLHLGKMYKGYWQPVKPDWLFGCGEFGAEGLDPLNVMDKYYPKEWLGNNQGWNPSKIAMAQTYNHHFMWFPPQSDRNSWITASQDFQAWAVKFTTETFRRNNRMVSFAVHLFIDAWPAGWMKTIMDVDRQPKKAYFAYRDALQPLSVSLRTDRFQWSPGEEATVESWICNDRNEIPEGLSLKYQVYVGNKLLVSQAVMPRMEEMRSVLQGLIHFKVPAVSKRTTAKVIVSLESPETVIDQNQLELTLYPQPDQALVKVLCTTPHTAWVNELTQQMGWTKTETMANARVVVVSLEEYQQNKISLDAYVADGGKLLFFNLPEGRQQVGESTVQIEKTIMGDYFFVNPTTELLKAGFTPKDFFLWYDKKTACIEPLVSHLVKAAKWTPLLSSGLTNWGTTEVEGYFACGRLDYGRGAYYICQLLSEGRMAENPAMKLLLNELINNK